VKALIAVVAYVAYFFFLFRFALDYAITGTAPRYELLIAGFTFIIFAVITILGITRWARKKFPYKEKNRNA
jgi:membrane protein implicated in regulation of membrane protease activity